MILHREEKFPEFQIIFIFTIFAKSSQKLFLVSLHFYILILCNKMANRILEELRIAYGIGGNSTFVWEKIYHEIIYSIIKKKKLKKLGDNKERCVMDELWNGKIWRVIGKSISKRISFVRATDRIRTKRLCKTICKPKVKVFPRTKTDFSKDRYSNKSSQWLWLAI